MPSLQARPSAKARLLALLDEAVRDRSFVKLTLGGYHGADPTLQKVFVRPVTLRAGERLSFVFRHRTRDVTQNLPHAAGLQRVGELIGGDFCHAHLFTTTRSAQLEFREGKECLSIRPAGGHERDTRHDRQKVQSIRGSPWLQGLGVLTADGRVARGMEAKYRQINRFVELLRHLLDGVGQASSLYRPSSDVTLQPGTTIPDLSAYPPSATGQASSLYRPVQDPTSHRTGRMPVLPVLRVVDMGCGKGYLTFAAYEHFVKTGWSDASVHGIEARPELVTLCQRVARESGFDRLRFEAGTIADAPLKDVDVLIALHACDTATDDALAKGVQAGAALILAAPCCHRELRPQLRPPPELSGALRHGILLEREAEFVTDALRAALLEWAGYDTRIFEFISPEHTSKNLMIAATKRAAKKSQEELEREVRELAAFYGIRSQRLATHLGLDLEAGTRDSSSARGACRG